MPARFPSTRDAGDKSEVAAGTVVWASRCLFSHNASAKFMVGLLETFSGAAPTNGAWFELDAAVDTNLYAKSRNASGTIQSTNCGAVTTGAGAWHRYDIRCDGGGNLTFTVDDVQVAAHATVPAATSLLSPASLVLGNFAGNRTLRLDWHYLLAAR